MGLVVAPVIEPAVSDALVVLQQSVIQRPKGQASVIEELKALVANRTCWCERRRRRCVGRACSLLGVLCNPAIRGCRWLRGCPSSLRRWVCLFPVGGRAY
ncbi:hypothetical protein D3C86_1878350 [compost metagenome]